MISKFPGSVSAKDAEKIKTPKVPGRNWSVYRQAIQDAFIKLNPRHLVGNPVMLVTEIGSLLTSVLWLQSLLGHEKDAEPVGMFR